MGRALWIASAAIFTSLLLYLAFIGHRERLVRVASRVPVALESLTALVDGLSLPPKDNKPSTGGQTSPSQTPGLTPSKRPLETVSADKPGKLGQAADPKVISQNASGAKVSMSDVEYNNDGEFILTGQAKPGVRLDFSISGEVVAQKYAGADGNWRLTVPKNVGPGQHQLEISLPQPTGEGKMVVVLPFVKARPEEIAALVRAKKVVANLNRQQSPNIGPTDRPTVTASNPVNNASSVDRAKKADDKNSPVPVTAGKTPLNGASKLAELARSQTVGSDAGPLTGILPQLLLRDGPALVNPKVLQAEGKKNQVQPSEQKIEKSPSGSRILAKPGGGPELVSPRQEITETKKTPTPPPDKPLARQAKAVDRKAASPSIDNKREMDKKSKMSSVSGASAVKKLPYTGGRKVSVRAGRGLLVVQPGNTLWDLAISIYGSGLYYDKLYRANRGKIANPQLIYPGQIIYAPDANPPTSIAPLSPPQWIPPE